MDNGGQHRKGVNDKKQREVKMEEQIEKVNHSQKKDKYFH